MSTTMSQAGTNDGGGRPRRSRARLALLGVGLAAAGAGFAALGAAPAFAQSPAAAAVAGQRATSHDRASLDVREAHAVVQRERAGHQDSAQDPSQDRSTHDRSTPDRSGAPSPDHQSVQDVQDR